MNVGTIRFRKRLLFLANSRALSGRRERPDRSMVNAPIGDRDRSGATLGVGG
jgi:hypothetical protein